MESGFTGATDSSHKIEIENKEINIAMPQDKEPATQWHSECCIYKVPKRLREVNPKAYTPKLISIGPIHRGNLELKDMERRKQTYCDKFFRRTEKAKEKFEGLIEENGDKIRNCYAEEITLPCGKEFVNMILLDSIFIIELFWMTANDKKDKNEYILSKPWLVEGIKNDLILLENQLPIFIIQDLSKQCDLPFITLACGYFSPPADPIPQELYAVMEGSKHFTDFHRKFFHPPQNGKITGEPIEHLYSAAKLLHTAGLVFQTKENQPEENQFIKKRFLLYIELHKKPREICPTSCLMHFFEKFSCFKCMQTSLVVPQIVVEDGTEELFRNLMALEQCHYPFEAYICNYIVLLDYLINSKEDVELLVDKRVIVNLLGSSEAVADMVNKLCLEIVETNSWYRPIADEINEHHDSPWNQNMASLRNVYFRDIWRGTATVVGVLVLVITILTFLSPLFFKNT